MNSEPTVQGWSATGRGVGSDERQDRGPDTSRLAALEATIERGRTTFVEVGNAIREIRDARLYRESYATFEDYCRERWGWSKTHANRQVEAANTAEILTPMGVNVENERQARELAPLLKADSEEVVRIWEQETERAEVKDVELTAKDLRRAVRAATKRKEQEHKKLTRLEERERAAEKMASVKLDDRIQVVHADFRDALGDLPDGSVDLILTDPPYPAKYLPLYSDLGREAAECLKPGSVLAAMVGQSYIPEIIERLSEHLNYHWTVAYVTPGGQAAQIWQRKVNTFWKPVLIFVKGEYNGDWFGDVARSDVNDNDKRFHRWGQSVSGMSDLMERLSRPGDMVVDPFVGGGSTAVVAALTGRRFLGCDLDKKAVDVTSRRVKEMVRVGSGERPAERQHQGRACVESSM